MYFLVAWHFLLERRYILQRVYSGMLDMYVHPEYITHELCPGNESIYITNELAQGYPVRLWMYLYSIR